VDPANISHWEGGRRSGPPALIVALIVVVFVVGAIAAGFVWLFNSPGVRIAGELYEAAGGEITVAHYSYATGGDTLTIRFADVLTRGSALSFHCEEVLPLVMREDLAPRVAIQHPGGAYVFDGESCPSG
jgi:hypothetical protein